jgi:16S rRNA (cytidine1402-2'-O)-methyltransferase
MGKLLYLIPVHISQSETPALHPWVNPELLGELKTIFAEDLRSARRYFRLAGFTGDLNQPHWIEIRNQMPPEIILEALVGLEDQGIAGILSEAGIPGVADPGGEVVSIAHQLGIRVIPLPGPSSIFLALAASGMNGQSFTFHGYLPIQAKDREKQLRQIEMVAMQSNYTQIFMETPYRNMQMMESILKVCRPDTRLCVAADITGASEKIRTHTIQDWRSRKINLHKIPAIFLLNQ